MDSQAKAPTGIIRWLKANLQGDPVIWAVAFLLALVSIFAVYSSTGAYALRKFEGNTEAPLLRHLLYIGIAFVAMWFAHKIDYRYYARISLILLIASVPLLILVFFIGKSVNDAHRWISIMGFTFQPSDLAKFALIAHISALLAKNQQTIREVKSLEDIKKIFLPLLSWIGIICGLILIANTSTGLVLFSTSMLLMLIGRVPAKYLMMLMIIGLFLGGIAMFKGERWKTTVRRVEVFLEVVTGNDPDKLPFQLQQSYIAIAGGGIIGKGPGNSTQRNFLPFPFSDFIYATIIEEYGLVGAVFIMFLFLVLLYRGLVTVANSNRAFGGLLSAGLSFMIVIQAFINMGVVVGLGPVTGLPLPLVSMGGTSMLFTGISLGIILSVSKGELEENNS